MSNLTKNEQNFLANSTVKKGLNVVKVNKLQQAYDKANTSSYETSLALAEGVSEAMEYFKTATAKEERKAKQIDWTMEDLANKGFKKYMSKGWMYKLNSAFKIDENAKVVYKACVQFLDENNHAPKLSIDELNRFNTKFVKTSETVAEASRLYIADWIATKEDAFVGEVETSESEESEESEVEVEMLSDILGLNFKNEDGDNVHVRVDESGRMTTTNTNEQIQEAIAYLTSKMK